MKKNILSILIKKSKKEKNKAYNFLPLWDLLGVTLGFGTTMLGQKAAMLCTASVEEVICDHYKSQLEKLGDDEKDLKKSIKKFREDEDDHKNLAYDEGATKSGLYYILDKVIQNTSKVAIKVSEKNLVKVRVLYPSKGNPSNFRVKNLEENFFHFCVSHPQ